MKSEHTIRRYHARLKKLAAHCDICLTPFSREREVCDKILSNSV